MKKQWVLEGTFDDPYGKIYTFRTKELQPWGGYEYISVSAAWFWSPKGKQ